MSRKRLWLLLAIPLLVGLFRLRFDADIFHLLPSSLPAVRGLQLQQRYFANARELLITLEAADPEIASGYAKAISDRVAKMPALVRSARWQPPWLDNPAEGGQNLAWLWLQQPPKVFAELASRLTPEGARRELAESKAALTTSLNPKEIAQKGYDPLGFTRLPGDSALAAGFDSGSGIFANADSTFRVIYVEPANERMNYREAAAWIADLKKETEAALPAKQGGARVSYTGGPAFLAEISSGMQSDLQSSIITTVAVIAALFWLAHRTWRPLLWLILALVLTLAITLAFGGLIFGELNVVSLGFAAVLLGLAVDYGLVGYQEYAAHPDRPLDEIRREVAPGIWYSAATTAATFALLGFAGLPGLAQLGILTAIGLLTGAEVMQYMYLPIVARSRPVWRGGRLRFPLDRLQRSPWPTCLAIGLAAGVLACKGLPRISGSADPLRPRVSAAYDAMDRLKTQLGRTNDPALVLLEGPSLGSVGRQLNYARSMLAEAQRTGKISSFALPADFWPQPENALTNYSTARKLAGARAELGRAAAESGFASESLALADSILDSWGSMTPSDVADWPTNGTAKWLVGQFAAKADAGRWLALGMAQPAPGHGAGELPAILPDGALATSWDSLGGALLAHVGRRIIVVTALISAMLAVSLWIAFRNLRELVLSFAALALSFGLLLAAMALLGWSWNLLSLVALPLLLGSSVDSTIHVQLALRRHGNDFAGLWRSTGKALLLCAGSNIAGFSSLAFTNNEGLASLDLVCAIGVGCVFAVCMGLLPAWWRVAGGATPPGTSSALYGAPLWRVGMWIGRMAPEPILVGLAAVGARFYQWIKPGRFQVVVSNLTPVLEGDSSMAHRAAVQNFTNFGRKLTDLWRWEAGAPVEEKVEFGTGREHFMEAAGSGRGVLLVTPHLGNWEFGSQLLLAKDGRRPLVLTAREPSQELTEIRAAARARRGIDTLVVGDNPFAFVEVINRLQSGGIVAILLDRPGAASAVDVRFFRQPFRASIAAAELARASGCVVLPVYIVREGSNYRAHACAAVEYQRANLGHRAARIELTQKILDAFEPVVRRHLDQWYHFVPVWGENERASAHKEHK